MAKRDASRALGGMAGRAASALRGRGKQLDEAISGATAEGSKRPAGKSPAPRSSTKMPYTRSGSKKKY